MRKQQFGRPSQRSRTTIKRILVVAGALLTMLVGPIAGGDEEIIKVNLVGYQETPLTINSPGSGDFTAKIHSDGTAIDYEL